jgi:hypothetical protein
MPSLNECPLHSDIDAIDIESEELQPQSIFIREFDNGLLRMAAQRSVIGTILFALLAAVHSTSIVFVIEQILDYYYLDWIHLAAQVFQTATFISYMIALFNPILRPVARFSIVTLCISSIVVSMLAFGWGYSHFDTDRLMILLLVMLDLIPATAFAVPPNSELAKLAPFYGDSMDDTTNPISSEMNEVFPPPV